MSNNRGFIGILAGLLVCGMVSSAVAQAPAKATPTTATDYCTSTGGELENRVPVYGTNGPIGSWLKLGGTEQFCQYTSASDGSRIHVSINTLYSNKPLLATLAYYAETPWNGQGNGNPASFYCTQLGGSDLFGGVNAAGGGWVEMGTIDEVLEACMFPDNSTIDSWGLFYHSDNIVRGTDLSTVLRYADPYPKSNAKSKTSSK